MRTRRRLATAGVTGAMAVLVLSLLGSPASAEITSGRDCFGDATIDGVNYTQDQPQTDPVLMPPDDEPDRHTVPYKGYVGFENKNHEGNFALMFGPIPIPIVSWGDDNPDDDRATGEQTGPPPGQQVYNLGDAYDKLPAIRGQFRVRGTHTGSTGGCTGMYLIEFPGNALDSPVTLIGIVGAGFSAVLVVFAGRRRPPVLPDDLGAMQ